MSAPSTRLGPTAARVVALALAMGGCAMPGWVPWIGKSTPKHTMAPAPEPAVAAPGTDAAAAAEKPAAEAAEKSSPRLYDPDDPVTDRIVAVVNSDAITLNEVIESVVAWRQENQSRSVTDEEIARDFLSKLIDMRLQLQEAERERITVDDTEVEEELADRMKKLPGQATKQDFEAAIQAQGMTMDMVKKRLRDSIRLSKVVRRKVTLRVTVNDKEIDRYLEENRAKLETGLTYHARHLLVIPETTGPEDTEWEKARIRAELLRTQILAGADFAEVARQQSADASAKDGGDLGTLKRGELATDIEAEILRLAPGQVSAPYRSSLGYHLFRLESKEVLEGDFLVRARQQIRDILFREKYESRLAAWLREIKQRAIIEVRL